MYPRLMATITVTNNNDETCRRLVLIEHHEIVADGNSSNDLLSIIADVERRFKEIFPRGMSYTVPFTTVDIAPAKQDDADRLLRQAYASGQLQGTIVGGMVRDYFGGISHNEIVAAPYSDPAAKTVSLGGQPMYRDEEAESGHLAARTRADQKAVQS